MYKKILLLGLASYTVLLFLSLLFFKERTIFLDVSFLLFNIIKDGDFAIQANRFGSIFTQIFPLLSSKLGLPLKWVMINYSAGVVLYYFSIFLLCIKVFINWRLGLAILLFNTLIVSYTFWWMQIEFAQGIALTILYFALITQNKEWENFTPLEISVYLLLIVIIAYFHPLLPIVFLFLSAFFVLREEEKNKKKPIWAGLLILIIVVGYKLFIGPSNSYDSSAMSGINNFKTLFPNYINIPANINFIKYLITDYYLLPVSLIIISVFYIKQQQLIKFGMVLIFFVGYLLLINVSNYQGMPQFHIESFYLPLSIFVILPLVYDVFPKIQNQRLLIIILAVALAIRLIHIGLLHRPYSERIAWQERLIQQTNHLPNKKLLIAQKDVPIDTLIMSWGSSYEFWLLSSLKDPNNVRSIIIDENPAQLDWALSNNKGFLTEWGMFPYEELPKRYFNLTDTSTYYQKIDLK